MSRSKEDFRPRQDNLVRVFTCGPSTYRRPHIGNYRTFLYEDVLLRYLMYRGYDVNRTINFTDVEDKTIVEAENKGRSVEDVTAEVHEHFFRETELLGILLPDEIPRSSTSVDQAVEIIKTLVDQGHAYWHEGDVFFDPLKFKDFGKLYGLDMSKWPKKKVRFKRDTYEGNRWNRGDFILWHGHENGKESSAYWDTEIGKGRPAWNIQDPAMILQQLGTWVDINCGGIDNIYRHHDYNIAVMEAFSGQEFAGIYMHGEHLIVDGKAMSKSRGNILYPDDLVDQGYEHKHLRFFLISTHYRKKLNFTDETFRASSERLDSLRSLVSKLIETPVRTPTPPQAGVLIDEIARSFEQYMDDDLRLGDAVDAVHSVLSDISQMTSGEPLDHDSADRLASKLYSIDEVIGAVMTARPKPS